MRLNSLGRRLGRLEVGNRRSLGIDAFAQVPQDQLEAAMEIYRSALESGNLDDVNSRLAADAPGVLAAGSLQR